MKQSSKIEGKNNICHKLVLGLLLIPFILTACQSNSASRHSAKATTQTISQATNKLHQPIKLEKSQSQELNTTLHRIISLFHRSSLTTIQGKWNNPDNIKAALPRLFHSLDPYGIILSAKQRQTYLEKYKGLFQYPLNISPVETLAFFSEYKLLEKKSYSEMKDWLVKQPISSLIRQPASDIRTNKAMSQPIDNKRTAYIHFKVYALSQFTSEPQLAKEAVINQIDYVLNQSDTWEFTDIALLIRSVFPEPSLGMKYMPAPPQHSPDISPASAGLMLKANLPDCYTIKNIHNTAAKQAGLKIKDCLYGITKAGTFLPFRTHALVDEIRYLQGKNNEIITLHIERRHIENSKWISLPLTLQPKLKNRSNTEELLNIDREDFSNISTSVDGSTINYFRIYSFPIGIAKQLKNTIANNPADFIILDLRGNGGGALTEVINSVGLFIGNKPFGILNDGERTRDIASKQNQITSASLIILTDNDTSAGAEIFAAAMQDNGRGKIVGTKTGGVPWINQARTLDRIYDLETQKKGYVQFPIQEYTRLSGQSLRKGLTPDFDWQSSRIPVSKINHEDMQEIIALITEK